MKQEQNRTILRPCIVCGDSNPFLLNLRAYKYLYSIRPGKHTELISQFSRRFSQIKSLHSLEGDLVLRPFADFPKWFNFCLKNIKVLSIDNEKYYKSRFFLSKMRKARVERFTINYNKQTRKLLKGLIGEVQDLALSIKETVLANRGEHILGLAKLFNRSYSLKNCNLYTEGFQALSLEYLRMAIERTKTSVHFQVFFDLNKMKYERLSILSSLKEKVSMGCNMDFVCFKISLRSLYPQLKKLEASFTLSQDQHQLPKLGIFAQLPVLEDLLIGIDFGWSSAKFRDVLNYFRFPSSLRSLSLIFLSCRDNKEPLDDTLEEPGISYEQVKEAVEVVENTRKLKCFMREIRALNQLKKLDFHLRYASIEIPLYYYVTYAVGKSLTQAIEEINVSFDFDDTTEEKEYVFNFDITYFLLLLPPVQSLKKLSVKAKEITFRNWKELGKTPCTEKLILHVLHPHEHSLNPKQASGFFRMIGSTAVESLRFPCITEEMIVSFMKEGTFQKLRVLELSNVDDPKIDKDLYCRFFASLKSKPHLREIKLDHDIDFSEEELEEMADILNGNSKLQIVLFGREMYGISKDGFNDEAAVFLPIE